MIIFSTVVYLKAFRERISTLLISFRITKRELQKPRSEHGWNDLIDNVHSFCEKNDILVMEMENYYVNPKKTRQRTCINSEQHYQINNFFSILDMFVEELNARFNVIILSYFVVCKL